ncbi:MAG: helix-turn-helix domain-containing protein [Actinocrinis sp.]
MRRIREASDAIPALPAAPSGARPALRIASIATGGKGFGALLQEFRHRAGLTQTQLADLSTVSVRAIRDLELGRARHPRRDTVRLLASALRLTGERRAMLDVAAGHDATDAVITASLGSRLAPPPAPAGPFVGRDEEARILYELLAGGADRLITVVGLGGVGKTRLVLAVAHALHERRRMPVLWAARLTDLLVRPMTPGTDTPDESDPDAGAGLATGDVLDGAVDDLASFIGDRPFLLVLDDRETENGDGYRGVTGASASGVRAASLVRLLSQCPQLRVVTTSRSADAAPTAGRRLFPLVPLAVAETCNTPSAACAVPSVAGSGIGTASAGAQSSARPAPRDPAAEIVYWHLRRVRPQWHAAADDLAAVRELCRLLDGIPLALESAAAWSLIASPARLAYSAASDPFAVAEPPGDCVRAGGGRMRAALGEAVATLTPRLRELLAVLSTWDQPWSLDDVSTRLNLTVPEVSYAAHNLLVRSLIRPAGQGESGDGTDGFTVLNLVRYLMDEAGAARSTLAADGPAPASGPRRTLSEPNPRMSLVRSR